MQFTVNERKIKCEDIVSLIGDNGDYEVTFSFDEEWEGQTKTARFLMKNRYVDVILKDDACTIPVEILKQGILAVGVYAEKITSTICEIPVKPSIKEKAGNVAAPADDVYAQLLKQMQVLEQGAVSDERISEALSTFMETDDTLVKNSEFDTKLNAYLVENPPIGYTSVKVLGAKGDGETDDSLYFKGDNLYVPSGTYLLDKDTILELPNKNIVGNGSVKWKDWTIYKRDERYVDGVIPVSKLKDRLYTCMNLPSVPTNTFYTTTDNKLNPAIARLPLDTTANARTIGAIMLNYDKESDLPDEFTICFGRMKLFILKNDGTWIKAKERKYPYHMRLYSIPWSGGTYKEIEPSKIEITDDCLKLRLNKTDMRDANGTEWCVHFWTDNYNFGVGNHKAVIGAFEVWVENESLEDYFNTSSAIDFTNDNSDYSSIRQAYWAREEYIKCKAISYWGSNIMNDVYDDWVDFAEIQNMWNSFDSSDLSMVTSQPKSTTDELAYGMNYIKQNGNLVLSKTREKHNWMTDFVLNPIKQINVPYANNGKANCLCKLYSCGNVDAIITVSSRKSAEIKYGKFAVLIDGNGSNHIKLIEGLNPFEGMITVGYDADNNINNIYVKAEANYRTVTVDVQLLNTSSTNTFGTVEFDTDLFNYGGFTTLALDDKWIDASTVTDTLVSSPTT